MNPPNHRDPASGAQAPGQDALSGAAERHIINDVAAGFAHELNQPLAAIAAYAAGAATLLRRDPDNARQALGIIQAIAGQALRAGVVVEDIRGVVRPGRTEGASLDPNAVVRATLPLLQSLASQRAVQLLVELRTPVPGVAGDADRIGATLILLIGSALDTITRTPLERQRLVLATDCGPRDVALRGGWSLGTLFEVRLPRYDA
jgi:two-component system, LuxR family, sensor histidine kinase DctS